MTSETNINPAISLGSVLLKALIAGLIAAVINVGLFFVGNAVVGPITVDMNQTGDFAPMPFFLPAVASIIPMLVAGIGLWIARRFIPKGNTVFVVGTAILVLLSLAGPFSGQIGTTGAAIVLAVMHLVVGAVAIGYLAK